MAEQQTVHSEEKLKTLDKKTLTDEGKTTMDREKITTNKEKTVTEIVDTINVITKREDLKEIFNSCQKRFDKLTRIELEEKIINALMTKYVKFNDLYRLAKTIKLTKYYTDTKSSDSIDRCKFKITICCGFCTCKCDKKYKHLEIIGSFTKYKDETERKYTLNANYKITNNRRATSNIKHYMSEKTNEEEKYLCYSICSESNISDTVANDIMQHILILGDDVLIKTHYFFGLFYNTENKFKSFLADLLMAIVV